MLDWHIKIRHNLWVGCHFGNHCIGQTFRISIHKTYPFDTVNFGNFTDKCVESAFAIQILAVCGNVLCNDNNFLHAFFSQEFCFFHTAFNSTAAVRTAYHRDCTVVAAVGAAFGNLEISIVLWCGDNAFCCDVKVGLFAAAAYAVALYNSFHNVADFAVAANAHNCVNFWNITDDFVAVTFGKTACNNYFKLWIFHSGFNCIEDVFNCFFLCRGDKTAGIDDANISFGHIGCGCVTCFEQCVCKNICINLVFRAAKGN